MIATKKIAIFGGSFDPIHNGHLYLITSILDSKIFEKLIVIPAGDPWQKEMHASKLDRLAMTQIALKGIRVDVNDCEVSRTGPSYAIDTAKHLIDSEPQARYTWIIGSDALQNIATWHRLEELTNIVDFLVIIRPGHAIEAANVHAEVKWSSIEIEALDISSTAVRHLLAEGRDVSHLIPQEVHRYIIEKRLYGAA